MGALFLFSITGKINGMKKYTYKFTTEEIIEINEDTYALLKEADRLDRNNAQTYRRHNISLDSFGFEPEFLAVEDDALELDPPSTPAYQYALRHSLRPRKYAKKSIIK